MCVTHLSARLKEVDVLPRVAAGPGRNQRGVSAGDKLPSVLDFLANVRGLRQAAGVVCKQVAAADADVFFLSETHLHRDEPVCSLILPTYKMVSRFDRNKHGGGVGAGCKSHLLATPLDLVKYTESKNAEMAGFELDGVDYIACYTSNSSTARILVSRCTQYLLDHPLHQVALLGDFNGHHAEWLQFSTGIDAAGVAVQEMCAVRCSICLSSSRFLRGVAILWTLCCHHSMA